MIRASLNRGSRLGPKTSVQGKPWPRLGPIFVTGVFSGSIAARAMVGVSMGSLWPPCYTWGRGPDPGSSGPEIRISDFSVSFFNTRESTVGWLAHIKVWPYQCSLGCIWISANGAHWEIFKFLQMEHIANLFEYWQITHICVVQF